MQPIPIIDTHTHLADAVFDPDREGVLARAREAGIQSVISVGETMADAEKNLALSREHGMLKAAAGLYPSHLDTDEADRLITFIREHRDGWIAIGEVGLDHWVVKEEQDKEIQKEIFRKFIFLSLELDLPLNVHSRSAGRHAAALLQECGAKRVQMHAFDGKASSALPAVEAGYFFSVPPSIARSEQKKKLVKQLPLSCLLLETDSPVLGPVHGERNEPANIRIAIEWIAAIKQVPEQRVIEAAYENTLKCYGEGIL